MPVNWIALAVFVAFFGVVTLVGFMAANWRRGDLDLLHEWGLGGGRFGTLVTWFLLGGDLYTAYTFIAVPALAFGAGALAFFAVPYTTIVYPMTFVVFPRLWSVCRQHGYVTAADFVRGRFCNRWLALAITVTGLLATMPYIALQLEGLQVVIAALGLGSTGWLGEVPLILAFVILAAFTYTSGLRAPAAIAVVKDVMIYITIFAALIVIPGKLGGFSGIFAAIPAKNLILATPPAGSTGAYTSYASLALGSAAALFLYPHAITAVLSSSSRDVIRRNSALLPAYSIVLALISLLGFMAYAAHVDQNPAFKAMFAQYKANFAVPALFLQLFPDWFTGFAFAAIGIGALVPAAVMSIAAANLWTRNIYVEFINPNASAADESRMAKLFSLVVKFGALFFILFLPLDYAIQLQLLGGVWMSQTLPAVLIGLYTRRLSSWALLLGWAAGIGLGTWMVALTGFKNATYAVTLFGLTIPAYAAIYGLVVNIVVALLGTLVINALRGMPETRDNTVAADYV
ncbi:sodium:solute symporter [Lichenihabitans sp. Uapishka_5]|uniref:monocarboxylate uptake permease MctP n=1 Tax=Lichenihabitans sp. Uapishka_5 TaxID=3037302 RepID=UPI0029E805B9|nr:sodium:solute symporter [Lichenihabitans sp. Uapishka_5]MDX7949882.1 sodium:solute symporter [Lichenihabitans sp. Uapishka_5]